MKHRTSRHLALRPLAIAAAIAGTSAALAQEAATLGQVVVTAPAMDAAMARGRSARWREVRCFMGVAPWFASGRYLKSEACRRV